MATYEKGDRNADEVKLFQQAIGIKATGKYGKETVDAVKAWQKDNGQKADGMVGPDMLLVLGLHELLIVENGDEGELVKRIQEIVDTDVDGIFGDNTENAVRRWQSQNGLKKTGSADLKTLAAMGLLEPENTEPAEAEVEQPAPAPAKPQKAPAVAPQEPLAKAKRPSPSAAPPTPAPSTGAINSWAYQIADVDPKKIAALPVDLVVIDYAADGDEETEFKPAQTAQMKRRPDGGTKKLISYMSIGEAEDYRYYWNKDWEKNQDRPAWLDDVNPEWKGNYKVRYWDPDWQAIIMGSPGAYLDRIIAAGFDGVYLDIIDAFEYWRDEKKERPTADTEMIAFVTEIANYARAQRPDFMIIPQNGEELLQDAGYRKVISAIGKEDIFYGKDGDAKVNSTDDVEECLKNLAYATEANIPVLAVEYLKNAKQIADATQKLQEVGCCTYFGPRDLDKINTSQFA